MTRCYFPPPYPVYGNICLPCPHECVPLGVERGQLAEDGVVRADGGLALQGGRAATGIYCQTAAAWLEMDLLSSASTVMQLKRELLLSAFSVKQP